MKREYRPALLGVVSWAVLMIAVGWISVAAASQYDTLYLKV